MNKMKEKTNNKMLPELFSEGNKLNHLLYECDSLKISIELNWFLTSTIIFQFSKIFQFELISTSIDTWIDFFFCNISRIIVKVVCQLESTIPHKCLDWKKWPKEQKFRCGFISLYTNELVLGKFRIQHENLAVLPDYLKKIKNRRTLI